MIYTEAKLNFRPPARSPNRTRPIYFRLRFDKEIAKKNHSLAS